MRDLCAGALIRACRLERHFSQEGLCRGICAASYLSKIEKGTVTPSEEIVQKLFAALDLTYTTDEAVLAPLRKAMDNARAGILRPRARPRAQRGNRLSPVLHALSGGTLSGSAPLCPAGLRPRRAVIEPLFTQDESKTGGTPDAQAI